MKKIILIWIFVIFLMVLPFVNAGAVIYNHTFNTNQNFTLNAGCTIDTTNGYLQSATSSGCLYINKLPNLTTNKANWSIVFYGLNLSISGGNALIVFNPRNNTAWGPGANTIHIAGSSGTPNVPRMYFNDRNNLDNYPAIDILAFDPITPFELQLNFLTNESFDTYVNGTFTSNQPLTAGARMNENITFFRFQDGGGGSRVRVKGFAVFNGTVAGTEVTVDTTPPLITIYSSQGASCTNWNTNTSNPCTTSDTTPSLYFNTSESAFCAIGTSNSNYTAMGSSRNCTVGEGTIEHVCDLTPQDELVYDNSIVYISCKDTSENMNTTSTSGPLSLTITGLESAGRTSIGIGIQNALLTSYTNYTDLQIYARNLSNAQVKGTFDRAAKKGNKMWAFNRIGVSDSYVNMFNLSPVLYTLELANKTSSNITLQVEQLINATK